jgi:hypothetical protein
VDASPKTGNGIVAFYALSNDQSTYAIIVDFYSKDTGAMLYRYIVDSGPFTTNNGCNPAFPLQRCGTGDNCNLHSGQVCMRSKYRVPVTTKVYNGSYYLYIGYDRPCVLNNTNLFKSSLLIYDISDESALYSNQKAWWISSQCNSYHNEFGTMVAASKFNDGVGFFYYQQTNNAPCSTVVQGATDVNAGLFHIYNTGNLAASFPSVIDWNTNGMGDYHFAIKKGTSDGLVTAFAQSTVTMDTTTPKCSIHCTYTGVDEYWTMIVRGSTVVP